MKAISPDTPANHALIRAVQMRDIAGVEEALKAGADVNTTHRTYDSALLLAVLGADQGSAAIVARLLTAGAPLFHISHRQGRTPIDEAIRQGRWKVFKVFQDAVGGAQGFLREDYMVQAHLLDLLMYGAMQCRQLLPALKVLMTRAQLDLTLRRQARIPTESVGWPWDNLVAMWRHDGQVLEEVERLYPFPRQEQMTQVSWMRFMCAAAHGGTESLLLKRIVDNTPAQWWVDCTAGVLPRAKKPLPGTRQRANLPEPTTVLEYFMAEGHRKGTMLALQRIANDPEAMNALQPHLNRLLEWAALQGSRPLMLALVKLRAGGEATPQAVLNAMLRQTLNKEYDSHHRLGLMRSLLARGAQPNDVGQAGESALHMAAEWDLKHRLEDILNLLVEHGGDWTTLDAAGLTPLDRLQVHHPHLAATKRQHLLNARLASPDAQEAGRARL